jgi:hypothetical protein
MGIFPVIFFPIFFRLTQPNKQAMYKFWVVYFFGKTHHHLLRLFSYISFPYRRFDPTLDGGLGRYAHFDTGKKYSKYMDKYFLTI